MERTAITNNWVDFHLTYVRNPGAAWGSFANAPENIRLWLFYAVTVFVSGMILYLFKSSHPGQRLARTALVLVLSGAAGNFIDRLLLKYVIDFLHFHWKVFGWEYSFPVFNWADIAINVGIALMLIDMVLQEISLRKGLKQQLSPQSSVTP
jgi:signal peptidase II